MNSRSLNFKDLTGLRFGRLVVVSIAGKMGGVIVWECVCDCKKITFVKRGKLQSGRTKSCGCLRKETNAKRCKTHGLRHSPEYSVWRSLKSRCENKKDISYPNYGGRGIKVCRRWQKFENFYADMGPRPEGSWIDRKCNNGNYTTKNCRWATPKEQNRNKRNSRLIKAFGLTMTMAEWAEKTGINAGRIWERLKYKWDPEKAVSQPIKKICHR